MHVCGHCGIERRTLQGVRSHITQTPACNLAFERQVARRLAHQQQPAAEQDIGAIRPGPSDDLQVDGDGDVMMAEEEVRVPGGNPYRVTVEEVEDIEAGGLPKRPWVGEYPEVARVGEALRQATTIFEELREKRRTAGTSHFAPFDDREEWELAKWLMTSGLSQEAIDEYLTLPIVRQHASTSRYCGHLY